MKPDQLARDIEEYQIETVTPLEIYRSRNMYGPKSIVAPICPLDAFGENERQIIHSAVQEGMLKTSRIDGRLYVNEMDLQTFERWTDKRCCYPQSWDEDVDLVASNLNGVNRLDFSLPGWSRSVSPTPDGDIRGPIVRVSDFDIRFQQVLTWCAMRGLIWSVVLDGGLYLSFRDVYGPLFDSYTDDGTDGPGPEDVDRTYDAIWSCMPRSTGNRYVKPRGLKSFVHISEFPKMSIRREIIRSKDGRRFGAYPENVADQAAHKFRALYLQDGFKERFRLEACKSYDRLEILPLSAYAEHERKIFRQFITEGGIDLCHLDDDNDECVRVQDLIYYDMFTAKIIEEQYVAKGMPIPTNNVWVNEAGQLNSEPF